MENDFLWWVFFFAASLQGILVAGLILFSKKNRYLPNRYLGGLVLVFSIMLLFFIAYWNSFQFKYMHLNYGLVPIPFLLGPFFYGYVYSIGKKKSINFYHWLPFFLVFLAYCPFYFHSAEWKLLFFKEGLHLKPLNRISGIILGQGQYLSLVLYSFFATRLVRKTNWENHKKKQFWVTMITYFFIGVTVMFILGGIGINYFSISRITDYSLVMIMSIFAYSISAVGFLNPQLFEIEEENNVQKYSRSSLNKKEAETIMKSIQQYMVTQHPYMNESFRLDTLSAKIKVPSHHISQVLNQFYQTSFSDFINELRIEKAKELLTAKSFNHITIEGIAYEVGFNSRTTFYNAFKKFTGVSPSTFQKQNTKIPL